MTLNSESWKPTVSNVIMNTDETLDPGNVHIESAHWEKSHENIRHFEIAFTYTPPESSGVESIEFVLDFPTEFRHVGSLYGWFGCENCELIALDPDDVFTKVKVLFYTGSVHVKKWQIRGVFILNE